MSPKDFLLEECTNLDSVLRETLRYKYGSEGSREFYEECQVRLEYITAALRGTDPKNSAELWNHSSSLQDLGGLISRIERSSLGEYSWPFVEELKKIAGAICAENTALLNDNPPKVHVLSDGGLSAYSIYTEAGRPAVGTQRILTIVFPRTLKHFVLLHSILGHELGHAMYQCSKHQSALKAILNKYLLKADIFQQPDAIRDWLFSANAPGELKVYLLAMQAWSGLDKNNCSQFINKNAWIEEILCDFIGVLTFGPSFIAAHCNLLYASAPSGCEFGLEHPPTASRVNLMLAVASLLGYDRPVATGKAAPQIKKFWDELHARKATDPWFELFTHDQIKNTIEEMKQLLDGYPPASFPKIDDDLTECLYAQLVDHVPPVGFSLDAAGSVKCDEVDFRHILYVGWLASGGATRFLDVNRLCEHAIMQQRAISLYKQ